MTSCTRSDSHLSHFPCHSANQWPALEVCASTHFPLQLSGHREKGEGRRGKGEGRRRRREEEEEEGARSVAAGTTAAAAQLQGDRLTSARLSSAGNCRVTYHSHKQTPKQNKGNLLRGKLFIVRLFPFQVFEALHVLITLSFSSSGAPLHLLSLQPFASRTQAPVCVQQSFHCNHALNQPLVRTLVVLARFSHVLTHVGPFTRTFAGSWCCHSDAASTMDQPVLPEIDNAKCHRLSQMALYQYEKSKVQWEHKTKPCVGKETLP